MDSGSAVSRQRVNRCRANPESLKPAANCEGNFRRRRLPENTVTRNPPVWGGSAGLRSLIDGFPVTFGLLPGPLGLRPADLTPYLVRDLTP